MRLLATVGCLAAAVLCGTVAMAGFLASDVDGWGLALACLNAAGCVGWSYLAAELSVPVDSES
jgi:hypothetical protein